MKSQKNLSSISEVDYSPRIEKIKIARRFSGVLKQLGIIPLTDKQLHEISMYLRYNNLEGAERARRIPSGFGLKECKDYVERLYKLQLLK